MSSPVRDLVFISYSPGDPPKWPDLVRLFLSPRVPPENVWCDAFVPVGNGWERKSGQALARASVGVLLVNQSFINSEFIHRIELPDLRKAAELDLLTLVGIPISSCDYKFARLPELQWAFPPDQPLDLLPEPELNRALVEISRKIHDAQTARTKDIPTEPEISTHVTRTRSIRRKAVAKGPPGALHGVPDLPPHYLPRPEDLQRLKQVLLRGGEPAGGFTTAAPFGITGPAGAGKSVLAAALAADEEVRRFFTHGIFWMPPGHYADSLRLQRALLNLAGEKASILSLEEGRARVRRAFAQRICLVVLDGIGGGDFLRVLDALGSQSRILMTLDPASLPPAGVRTEPAGPLSDRLCIELLARWADLKATDLPGTAGQVAYECGRLPLALSVAGARAREGLAWDEVLDALEDGRREFLDHEYASVFGLLRMSTDALPAEERQRYLELTVFPPDVHIPDTVVLRLWQSTAGMEGAAGTALLERLGEKALLQRSTKEHRRAIAFHDLQRDFLRIHAEDLPILHEQLLRAFAENLPHTARGTPAWWMLPRVEVYPWVHLVRHLAASGRYDELRGLLLSFSWLEAKLHFVGIEELLSDFQTFSGDQDVTLLAEALRISARVLASRPDQLRSQLIGRLQRTKRPRIQALLEDAAAGAPHPWLRPVTASLREPMSSLRLTLGGHSGTVTAVAATQDGQFAVSASSDYTLRVWNLESGREVWSREGHTGEVTALAVTLDGRYAVSGGKDSVLKVWEMESGREIQILEGHAGWVTAVTIRSDGRQAVSGSSDHTLRAWDLESGITVRELVGHAASVIAVMLTDDESQVVSGDLHGTVKVWDLESGREVQSIPESTGLLSVMAVTDDGRRAVTGSSDGTLKVWDLETGGVRTLEGHTGWVRALTTMALLDDEGQARQYAVSGAVDGTLLVWDLETGHRVQTLMGHTNWVTAVTTTREGSHVISGSADRTLRLWEREVRTLVGHKRHVAGVAITPDGRHAVSASWDGLLKVWELQSGRELGILEGHTDAVETVAISPGGSYVASGSADRTIRVWDLETGRVLRMLTGHRGSVTAVAVPPNARYVVSGSADQTVRVWDLATGREIRTLSGHAGRVTAVALTPDGRWIVSASWDGRLKVWELESGRELWTLEGHTGAVETVTISSDGNHAFSWSADQTIRRWDLEKGCELRTLAGHEYAGAAVAISRDGLLAISGSADRTIDVRAVELDRTIASFTADKPIRCCAIAPVGGTIVAGGDDGELHLLRLEAPDTAPASDGDG